MIERRRPSPSRVIGGISGGIAAAKNGGGFFENGGVGIKRVSQNIPAVAQNGDVMFSPLIEQELFNHVLPPASMYPYAGGLGGVFDTGYGELLNKLIFGQ